MILFILKKICSLNGDLEVRGFSNFTVGFLFGLRTWKCQLLLSRIHVVKNLNIRYINIRFSTIGKPVLFYLVHLNPYDPIGRPLNVHSRIVISKTSQDGNIRFFNLDQIGSHEGLINGNL